MKTPALTAKAVFDIAHEIESPAERKAYLDQVCADSPEVKGKVEALLQAYEDAGSRFLNEPPLPAGDTGPYHAGANTPGPPSGVESETVDTLPPSDHPLRAEGPGTQIGPYRLVEKLGEGGMGAVYLAEQEQPIRRQVALKIIKPGMDSAQVVARFEVERQALTMMDHVNIARVFDAGTTEMGRPYFVMELVKGIPLARFCNDHRLTTRERLELFVPICQAIQHAHQKGVIHRDLKPANVLVALKDDKPVAKVIDFGLAKATEQPLTEHSQLTQAGAVAGTLEYMSPEQADPGPQGIDTRTDVYSLGVMLYELLTGTTPLDRPTLRGAGLIQVVMRIKEEDPPKPSARVSVLGERLATIAEQRKTEPAALAKLLRGELDWIALKALAKEREQRYDTASGFGQDVQRYLDDERVEACPPTARYRLGKFARKHRTLLATVGGILALLVAGVVGLILGIVRINTEKDKAVAAERHATDEKEKAVKAKQHETEAKRTAVAAASVTRQALAVTWTQNRMPSRKRATLGEAEKKNLRNMLEAYRQLPAGEGDSQETRAMTAETEYRVASLSAVFDLNDEAETGYRRAMELYEALAAEFKDEAVYRNELGRCNFDLAYLLKEQGKLSEAEDAYRRAIDWHKKVSDQFPDEPDYRRELADAFNDLGALLRDEKKLDKAEKEFRQAVTLGEKLVREVPDSPQYRFDLAAGYQNLGNAVRDQRNPKAALAWYGKAIDLLTPINPRPDFATVFLRNAHWDRANALGQIGDHAGAVLDWQKAIDLEKDADVRDDLRLMQQTARMEVKLKAQPGPAGELVYEAAAVHAKASAAAARQDEAALKERYATRALDLLERARAAGFSDDPQRIKAMLDSLEAGKGTKDRPEK
jgi:eukaryotic-like serine/threonine-protein kinase